LGADEQENTQGRRSNAVAERAAAVTPWARERKGERTVTGDGEKRESRRVTAGPEWIGKNKRGPHRADESGEIFTETRKGCTAAQGAALLHLPRVTRFSYYLGDSFYLRYGHIFFKFHD
jgi:hypothetical protein